VKTSFFSFVSWVLIGFGLGIALMSLILIIGGYSMEELQNAASTLNPDSALVLGWANVGHQLGAFVFPALLYYRLHRQGQWAPWFPFPKTRFLVIGALSLLIGAGCIDFFSAINLQILEGFPALSDWAHAGEEVQLQLQAALMNQSGIWGMAQVVILIALVPAFFEEYFFRGALFQWLLQWLSPWKVMILTGFIFSLVHFQFEGFLPRWAMGTFLGFLAYQTQSLWPSILAHFVNNLSGVIFFYQFNGSMKTPEDHWMSSPIWWVVSILGIFGIIYWLRKQVDARGW
jgi:uncharacterized protein